jgi:hypothetical protein
VLITPENETILIDFGIASKRCSECITCSGDAIYTRDLECDECAEYQDGRVDDIREVVKLVYQLLCGTEYPDSSGTEAITTRINEEVMGGVGWG